MEEAAFQEEQSLQAGLEEARERLDELVDELRVVDAELEGRSAEREQHELLGRVCAALDELDRTGGGALFWGPVLTGPEAEGHLHRVRDRIDAFQKQVGHIEERRQSIVEAIGRQEEEAELLEEEILEAKRREEERQLEWVVEREVDELPGCGAVMPWSRGGEDDDRFRRALAAALLASLVLGLIFPLVDLPLPDPWEPTEVPERLTRLVREEPPAPPAPAVQEPAKPQEEAEPAEEAVAEEKAPEPEAREAPAGSAPSQGILAFREKFSGLAEADPTERLGSQARIRDDAEAASGRPTRSMVTTKAPGSSGGINLSSLSRDVGGGGSGRIEGVQVARASSSIGGVRGEDRPLSDGPGAGRTDEEIQIVFDRHKAALYRLYNRELRKDPTLKGQMVLRLRIEPDGSVSLCEVKSSDMDAPRLATRVVARVKTFDFGAKEVPPVTILYPIDFLPAT